MQVLVYCGSARIIVSNLLNTLGEAMRDKLIFGLSIIWIIAFSVTLTIFLAIPLFFGEIFWYRLTDLVQMSVGKSGTISLF